MANDVVVVGAGPTGLTAAGELARRGVAVRVLDAAPAPPRGSRGKGMQPRTLEVLDPLGVTDRLVSLGRFRMPTRHHERDGTTTDGDLNPTAVPRVDAPWYRSMIIPQWRTEQVLRERLAELGVVVEQSARVTGLEQDEGPDGSDGGVTLLLDDGRHLAARYVVGADGGSSAVRHALGVSFLGETREEIRMMIADVEVDGLDRDHWHFWADEPGLAMLALCPLPASPTWQLQAGYDDPSRSIGEDDLQALVDRLGPRVRLRRVDWTSAWRLNVRMVERYRVGRVFLAGDAAHVHSPAGGQGMNTGIQDAVNLGWKLAAVLGGADESLLDTYEAERLPVAADVLGLSSRLLETPFMRRGFDGQTTLQLGVTYRGGPLAADDEPADDETTDQPAGEHDGQPTGPAPRPGDRAPEAPLAGGDTVFLARRRAEWTVLAFGVAPPTLGDAVQGVRVDDGQAWEIYGARPGELVLLRPDGYVAARSVDPAALDRWLDGVLVAPRLAEGATRQRCGIAGV